MNILASYEYVENLLIEFLQAVPFEAADPNGKMQPEHVWSPRLVTILQEICSQIDSYCRHELVRIKAKPARKHFDIDDYRKHFGKWLSERKLLFWQDENGDPVSIQPFSQWSCGKGSPGWWNAYNKVKHDRIRNKKLGTLKHCVEALAGLLFVILRLAGIDPNVKRMLVSSTWWQVMGAFAAEVTEDNDDEIWRNLSRYNVIETRLFTFPFGWWNDKIVKAGLVDSITNINATKAWGGFGSINNPAGVPGSERWKFWYNSWFDSIQAPFTMSTPYTPLI